MGKRYYKTEEEVKKALDIKDFRSIKKRQIMDFVSIIPMVDKEVAISIINQFPNYTDMAQKMVGGLMKLCDIALKDSQTGKKDVIESYKIVLVTLKDELKDGVVTQEEREKINNRMISIAEKIDDVNDKHNAFIKDIITGVTGTVAGVLIIGAAILGINKKN